MTLKHTPFRLIKLELEWILRGETNANWLSLKDCKIWNANASEQALQKWGLPYLQGDCGPIYGHELRRCGVDYESCDTKPEGGVD